MIQTGLVSVTFRKLQPAEIVGLVKQAGLQGIEWGGDIHVPHGDIQRAREVLKMTTGAGLSVAAYGSYYRVGCETRSLPFEKVLETAVALQAPTLRVWAGDRGSGHTDNDGWRKVVAEAHRISTLAAEAGLTIAFEYHEETLTDTSASACRLLADINRANVRSYWQPPIDLNFEARLSGLREIAPWLGNLHVFNQTGPEPEPFARGMAEWAWYMESIRHLPGERFCLLEFVKGDSPHQFLQDAQALKMICAYGESRTV